MQSFSEPITNVIQKRFSCRTYLDKPIEPGLQGQIQDYLTAITTGPLATPLRFHLVAATQEDRDSLKGLGTYGCIQGANGFIIGTMHPNPKDLEDYGYALEQFILYATDLGLGTCWLGGNFVRSNFSKKISLQKDERLPAVISIGYIENVPKAKQTRLRKMIKADNRLPWEALFFEQRFGTPLAQERAGDYAIPLEMVRLAPSASNYQPWRIIKRDDAWHFYLQRTKGYRERLSVKLLRVEDLQRIDMGIAMAHFDLTTRELGLAGRWLVDEPPIEKPNELTEYTISWVATL